MNNICLLRNGIIFFTFPSMLIESSLAGRQLNEVFDWFELFIFKSGHFEAVWLARNLVKVKNSPKMRFTQKLAWNKAQKKIIQMNSRANQKLMYALAYPSTRMLN